MARFSALIAAVMATAVVAQSGAEEITAPAVTPTPTPGTASVLGDVRGANWGDAAATEYTTVLVTVTHCPAYVTDCPERKTRTHTLTVPCSEAERMTRATVKPQPKPQPTEECETNVRPPMTWTAHGTGTGSPVVHPTGGPVIAGAGSVAFNAAGLVGGLAAALVFML